MIFSTDMLEAVLAGRKTQTRRRVKKGHRQLVSHFDGHIRAVFDRNNRPVYALRSIHALQPSRWKKGTGFIKITSIRRERVCEISHEDAIAEGFDSREAFFNKWRELYGKNANLDEEVWVLTFELPGRFE